MIKTKTIKCGERGDLCLHLVMKDVLDSTCQPGHPLGPPSATLCLLLLVSVPPPHPIPSTWDPYSSGSLVRMLCLPEVSRL